MKAMESILSSITGRDLIIQEMPAERYVIIARGRWEFHPISGARLRSGQAVHFYTDKLDPQEAAGGGTGNLTDFFQRLEDITRIRVINEVTDGPTKPIEWANNFSASRAAGTEPPLRDLLDNLTTQTSLEFIRRPRMVPVWFVRERSTTTQPVNRK
jgi:hypothetical protein